MPKKIGLVCQYLWQDRQSGKETRIKICFYDNVKYENPPELCRKIHSVPRSKQTPSW